MGKKNLTELSSEAADCIDTCGLRGEELRLYLAAWIGEVLFSGDLDGIRAEAATAAEAYEAALRGGSR